MHPETGIAAWLVTPATGVEVHLLSAMAMVVSSLH